MIKLQLQRFKCYFTKVFISYFIYDRKQAKSYCFSVLLKGPSIFFGFPDVRISPSRCLDGNQLFIDASHPRLPRRKFDNFVGRFYEELRNRRLVKLLLLLYKNLTSDRDRNISVGRQAILAQVSWGSAIFWHLGLRFQERLKNTSLVS